MSERVTLEMLWAYDTEESPRMHFALGPSWLVKQEWEDQQHNQRMVRSACSGREGHESDIVTARLVRYIDSLSWSATRRLHNVTCKYCKQQWEYIEAQIERDNK